MSSIKNIKQSFDALAKVAVIGDSSVGKTNILLRFVNSDYHINHIATIGIDFKIKSIVLDDFRLKMQIWDTAGQQRFRNLTGTVYQGANGIILVYSITDRRTFINIDRWMSDVNNYASQAATLVIIGNKVDLQSQRAVTVQQGSEIAKKYNAIFFQTSAKNNINIEEAFHAIAEKIKANFLKKNSKILGEPKTNDQKNHNTKKQRAAEVLHKQETHQNLNHQKIKLKVEKQQKKHKKSCC